MSSHVVVRDNQEPALIIANGETCSRELLDSLLEWSPLVVVLDSAMERVAAYGIKVDVLLGDFDLGIPDRYRESQYPIEIVHTPNQNKTDMEKAFDYLMCRGISAVNVIWATGRRADHSMANMTNIVRYKELKIVLLDDYSRIFRMPEHFEKWYPKDSILSLLPVGEVTGISSENLVYELKNRTLRLGYEIGSSNAAATDGIVKINYESGDLLLMECNDL